MSVFFTFMTFKDVAPMAISLFSLVIAVCGFWVSYSTYINNKKDKEIEKARQQEREENPLSFFPSPRSLPRYNSKGVFVSYDYHIGMTFTNRLDKAISIDRPWIQIAFNRRSGPIYWNHPAIMSDSDSFPFLLAQGAPFVAQVPYADIQAKFREYDEKQGGHAEGFVPGEVTVTCICRLLTDGGREVRSRDYRWNWQTSYVQPTDATSDLAKGIRHEPPRPSRARPASAPNR